MAPRERPLDEFDRKIMRALQNEARLTVSQLSEAVGLSATPCWSRVKRLEQEGYIDGYVTIFNQEKLGLTETVLIEVTLDRHDEEAFENFSRRIGDLPEVLEAYLTTGEYDYFIKVAVAGTAGYEAFLREKLYHIPGVRHSRSSFTLRCLKRVTSVVP